MGKENSYEEVEMCASEIVWGEWTTDRLSSEQFYQSWWQTLPETIIEPTASVGWVFPSEGISLEGRVGGRTPQAKATGTRNKVKSCLPEGTQVVNRCWRKDSCVRQRGDRALHEVIGRCQKLLKYSSNTRRTLLVIISYRGLSCQRLFSTNKDAGDGLVWPLGRCQLSHVALSALSERTAR